MVRFSDLRDLEQRRDELFNDVTSLHRRLLLRSDSFEDADSALVPILVGILEKQGISSANVLVEETLSKLDVDKKTSFETCLKALQDAELDFDDQLSYFLVLPLVSDTVIGDNYLSILVDSALLYVASRLSAKAVALSISGTTLSLRDAVKTAEVANIIYESVKDQDLNPTIEFGLHANRDAPDFSNVPVPQVVAAFDGATQVKILKSEVNDFFRKRLTMELVDSLCSVSVTVTGKIESALTLVSKMKGIDTVDSSLQQAVDILVFPFVNEVESVWNAGTYESAASVWTKADLERNSYTDHDPSTEDLIEELSQ